MLGYTKHFYLKICLEKLTFYFDFYGIFGRKIAKNCDFLDIESGIISTFFQSFIFAISYWNNAKLSYLKKKNREKR